MMLGKRGCSKNKKSQITLFVILAIILLIIVVTLFIILGKEKTIEEEFKEEAIPEEFKPVRDYVENCIHTIGLRAIKMMGEHGGYIDPFDKLITPITLVYRPENLEYSNTVSLSGDSEGAVPYYLYVPGKSDYTNYDINSMAPTVKSMEYQLASYMSYELPLCTAGFEELELAGFEVVENSIGAHQALIKGDGVEFYVNYDIDISKQGVTTKITKFKDVINFPFMKYYTIALSLMTAEMSNQFLEGFTMSLINYYSGLDFNKLPPIVEYTDHPYIITWSNSKVNTDLNGLLTSYLPALQVIGAKDYTPIIGEVNDIDASFFRSLSMDIFNESIHDVLSSISISFFYLDRTLNTKVQPSIGDSIRPHVEVKPGDNNIPKRQFNTYKFFYDVSYPVIVEIRGEEPGTEIPNYSYLFALEANVIENKAALAWLMGLGTVEWDYSNLNVTITLPEGAVVDAEGETISLKPFSASKSLFCDEDTWISGEISLRTADEKTKPLEGVTITYGCGVYDECWMGNTALDEQGNSAVWKGKLPICQGGYLMLSKDGYGTKTIKLSTEQDKNVLIPTQKLYKIRELEASVKKAEIQKNIYRDDWEWEEDSASIGSLKNIDAEEQVIVMMTQTGFETGRKPILNVMMFGKDGVEKQNINLVPGKYEITTMFVDNTGFIIPAECNRICEKLICCDSDRGDSCPGAVIYSSYTYYPEEPVSIIPALWGGGEIKQSTTGLFEVTATQLDHYKTIEFHVLKLPDLSKADPAGGCLQNLEEMNNLEEYSKKFASTLMPLMR